MANQCGFLSTERIEADIRRLLFIITVAAVFACDQASDAPANSPGLSVALGECMNHGAAKASADSVLTGRIHFQSRDSIQVALLVVLNCQATYAFEVAYRAPDTLAFEARDVGDSRSKCVCEKDVTLEYKSSGKEDLETVQVAKFETIIFSLVSE